MLWQVWGFVSPGLRPVERKFVGPFIGSALLLFGVGAAFAYFVMPIGLNFLATFLGGSAVYLPDINSYLSFLILLIVAFGVTFELPVVIILLGVLGIASSRMLRRQRKVFWVVIIFGAMLITPGADRTRRRRSSSRSSHSSRRASSSSTRCSSARRQRPEYTAAHAT